MSARALGVVYTRQILVCAGRGGAKNQPPKPTRGGGGSKSSSRPARAVHSRIGVVRRGSGQQSMFSRSGNLESECVTRISLEERASASDLCAYSVLKV